MYVETSNPAGSPCGSLGFSLPHRTPPSSAWPPAKRGSSRDHFVAKNLSIHRVNLWDSLGGCNGRNGDRRGVSKKCFTALPKRGEGSKVKRICVMTRLSVSFNRRLEPICFVAVNMVDIKTRATGHCAFGVRVIERGLANPALVTQTGARSIILYRIDFFESRSTVSPF